MKLYNYFRSSASFRVRIALQLKGLAYDYLPVHLVKGEHKQDRYAAVSASQLVPTIETVVAVGGIVRVANGCRVENARIARALLPREPLPMFQVVEYLRAFLGGRTGASAVNGLLIISGAFGVFSKKWVLAAGGYRTDTVGEDMELVLRMHGLLRDAGEDYRVVFVADPVCWTEVPADLRTLSRQRRRWQRAVAHRARVHVEHGQAGRAKGHVVGPDDRPDFHLDVDELLRQQQPS